MEEPTGIVASLPAEASSSTTTTTNNNNSTANATSTTIPMSNSTADPLSFPAQNSNSMDNTYQNTQSHVEEVPSSERIIPLPELKAMLRQQLEYYFSRENLATDAYLRSQMDGDQYVPIITISRFNQIRRLTEDYNLVVEALRESPYVQVDEAGEKVRPSQRSIVLILREIPESTPIKDLEELFSGENCPKFSRCEFAHNDTWYVLFETDEDAKKAYCYLREEAKTFHGKPIMARIKASLTSAPYSHKNGVCTPQTTEAYNAQQMPQQQQAQMQYTYANVPNESYNNQQICPPFYPPTMLQAWAPTTATCVDLGAVFSVNGLSPQTAYRPLPNTNKTSYPVRERQVKNYSSQQSHVNRSEPSSRYFRSQSSYLARQQQQQQQQQQPFHSLMNASACSYDYMTYPTGSRNLHSFGCDVNFFTTSPNVFFRKVQGPQYSSHTPQVRHGQLLLPSGRQIGVSAINTQDQSYIPVGSAMPFPKDAVTGAVSSISKQNSDAQGKENWGINQKQRSKRWSKENGTSSSSRPFSENSNGFFSNKGMNGGDIKPESPKFDLEANSFPPLPGCLDDNILGGVDVYESRLSDIVKGTVKPSTRDTKTQTSESGVAAPCSLMKDNSTFTIEEPVITSDGAFSPPTSSAVSDGVSNTDQMLTDKKVEDWESYSVNNSETRNDQSISNSINTVDQTSNENTATAAYSSMNSVATNTSPIVSLPANSVVLPPATTTSTNSVFETETLANVPNDAEKQSTTAKMPKVKQPDPLPKAKLSEVQSPKSKTLESSASKSSKVDSSASKENKVPLPPKPQRAANFQNKPLESSLNKEKLVEPPLPPVAVVDISAPKSTDAFSPKDKVSQPHPGKGRFFESSKSLKGPETELNMSFLTINGHADSESSVSSEDEKPFRKPTYSEVAMRAKDKVEKLAQELKEKERQEALVRHHRQQEIVAQSKQGIARGTFREFPRRVGDRPGSREWRERRKPARAASLPSTGQ